jgi:MinD superfamily P-loop ATPase
MRIAVASGKGGAGKTTVATNLAWLAAQRGVKTAYLDCDVEEPNGRLFLQPAVARRENVRRRVPVVDRMRCTHCGKCASICEFSAIVSVGEETLVFPDLCHSCGGCALVCPDKAIIEKEHVCGVVEYGATGPLAFVQGLLNIGEAMSTPVVRAVKEAAPADAQLVVLDAPPGTACPAVESVRGADLVLLVAEPTPFGLHDLKLAVAMVRALKRPFAVVVNKAEPHQHEVHRWCRSEGIPLFAEIPDMRTAAEAYSRGELVSQHSQEIHEVFCRLLDTLTKHVQVEAAS